MGEFKKRIEKLFAIPYRATEQPIFMNLAEATKGMVEEAKKEFKQIPMKIEQEISKLSIYDKKVLTWNVKREMIWHEEQKWFVRWFCNDE